MKDVQGLVDRIQEDYRSGKLQVPSLPEVAIKVNKYIGDPDANIASMAKVIQMDPALAAKLIQVANSAMYGGHGNAEDCRSAIARLGMTTTRNLVMSFALGNSFQIGSAIVRDIARATWSKSSDVAAISYILAKVTVGIIPDKALLAGLVHNIGAIPILRYSAEFPDLKKDRELITRLIDRLSRKLGSLVLKQWSFDDELVNIPTQVYNHNYDPGKDVSYQDIVIMAHVHSQFGKEGQAVPNLGDIASFRKLPIFQTGPDASIELLYEAREEVNMLTDMLTSAA
ncbi:MAG TPA: HDOD domain-containing protein [Gammaproteobacteria bacterium]|nr:HDOD domain-containing protein [Gammaproteobacteria bacterium]